MGFEFWKWRPYKVRSLVLTPFMPKRIEMVLPVPTKSLLKTSPDAAMLFAPFGCTTHLPLFHPFCSSITQFPRTLPEVTSEAESLMTDIFAIGPMYVLGGFQLHDVTSGNVLER